MKIHLRWLAVALLFAGLSSAQVFGPFLRRDGDVDSSSVAALAQSVCKRANARTDREKVEAIWRFFLTDGRFVKPGYWYHIAYWAYEEPYGQVLDANKLLNSYGFGLCYQIAPLLEAAWESVGLESRVWFLTGHTVAEVFYDGAYHYFDSDMMGYTTSEDDGAANSPVASVHQLERDPGIILRKLEGPRKAKPGLVPTPWYPADLRAGAMKGLAGLFSSAGDNWLFPQQRFSNSHRMNFALRPGERMTLRYLPEAPSSFYLPFQSDGKTWREVPEPVPAYGIRTESGPASQKDARRWGTGRLEFQPRLADRASYYPRFNTGLTPGESLSANGGQTQAAFEVTSPWVIYTADFSMEAHLPGTQDTIAVETSTDEGRSWQQAGSLQGPHEGSWKVAPAQVSSSKHGSWNVLSGRYRYLVRLRLQGKASARNLLIGTGVQLNPRSLPELQAGQNTLQFQSAPAAHRTELPFEAARVREFTHSAVNVRYLEEGGNGILIPEDAARPWEIVTELSAPAGTPLQSIDAGGRFLHITDGLAPDKFTAEVRKTAWSSSGKPEASLAWSTSPNGPFHTLWEFDPKPHWRDGQPIDRTLVWPEVDRALTLPSGVKKVYLRYRLRNMALDSVRQAVYWKPETLVPTDLEITHQWGQNGLHLSHRERIPFGTGSRSYTVTLPEGAANEALVFTGAAPGTRQ